MRVSFRSARVNLKALVILVLILGIGTSGVLLLHGYRKRSLAASALQSGLAAYEAKQYSKAAADLGRYLMVDHDNVDVLLQYGDAQMQRRPQTEGSLRQAISAFETVLRLQHGHPKASEVLVQYYLLADAPVEAERVARAWQEADPQNPRPQEKVAAALILKGKMSEAIRLLEEIVTAHPEQVEAVSSLAVLRLRQGGQNVQQAARLLDNAVIAKPESAEARVARARFYLMTRWNGSIAEKPESASTKPSEPEWYRRACEDVNVAENANFDNLATTLTVGRILLQIGEYERAKIQFDRAEKMEPAEPAVYLAIGPLALDMGDIAWGVSVVERGLKAPLGERRLDLLPIAVELFLAAGRKEYALEYTEQLRSVGTDSAMLLYLGGLINTADGEVSNAVQKLRDAVHLAPKNARARLALARAYVKAGELRHAAGSFQEYLRLAGPSATSARLELAGVYAALERWDEAARVTADAERESPFDYLTRLTGIQIRGYIARPGGSQPDPTVIEGLYEQASRLCTLVANDVRAQVVLAQLAAWRGHIKEAAEILNRARQRPDSQQAATVALIDIYGEAGDYQNAITECQEALKSPDARQRSSLQARLAQLYLAKGEVEEASRVIKELAALPAGPARSAVLLELARLLLKRNQQEQARGVLLQIVSTDERDVPSRLMLLDLPSAAGQGPSRQELVNQLKEIEGGDGLNWRLWQARIWLDQDDWSKNRSQIEALLKECLDRDAGWEEAIATLATMHEKAGEDDKAADLYRRALEISPQDQTLARHLLGVAFRTRQWQDVSRALGALPAEDPAIQPYRIALALQQGNRNQAEQLLKKRIEEDKADHRSRLQLASLMRSAGNAEEAERLLSEAAAIAHDAPEVLAARVDYYQSRSEWDTAMDLCNRALAKAPNPQIYLLRAAVQEARGLLQEAEADLRQVIQAADWSEKGFYALGQLYLKHRQTDKALGCLNEGLAVLPKSFPIRLAMVSIMTAGNAQQREAGTKLLEQLLAEKPKDEQVMLLQARQLIVTDPAEAQRIYDEIIRLYPTSVEAFRRSARIAADQGRRDRALQLVDRGLLANPRDFSLLVMKAELLAAEDPSRAALAAQDAVSVARSALNAEPNNEEAAMALARALVLAGSPADGAKSLENFLARNESSAGVESRLALAGIYMRSTAFDKADILIRQASELAPGDPGPILVRLAWHAAQKQWEQVATLALAFLKDHPQDTTVVSQAAADLMASADPRRLESAVALLEQAIQHQADHPALLAQLGLAYYTAGRTADAKSRFERALKLQPRDVGIVNNLAWLLCEDEHNPQAAEELAGEVIRTGMDDPAYPNLLDTWGVIKYRLGLINNSNRHLEESKTRLEECLRDARTAPSTRASATFHLARTMAILDREKGRKLLEELTADPGRMNLLSASDQGAARQLLRELTGQPLSTGHSGG